MLHSGLLCWMLGFFAVNGLIEIVEEQQCHTEKFRLTCRGMQSHIAILEAWYTSLEDYNTNRTRSTNLTAVVTAANDSELNQVYLYSSPKHDGYYEPMNHSIFENVTQWPMNERVNDSLFDTSAVNDSLVPVDLPVINGSGCTGVEFSRSYASWHEGDKRRGKLNWEASFNLRAPLSYRCTGVNHCSFVLAEDYPPAARWSPGVVYIKYACFDDTLSIHYCNREVSIAESGPDSEGYIRTPGYPNYYIGEECRWRLRVSPEQRIQITLLDVSLRSIQAPLESECSDYVSVRDSNGEALLSSCDQVELPLRLLSASSEIEVKVATASVGAFPKRGVLLHYKSVGCVTTPPPSDGYLVYRNEHFAHYMCNVNHVFPDTRERARVVWCYEDNRWNDSVPFCVEESALRAAGNDSADSKRKHANMPHSDMIVDIVIPSLLIAALFIGNAFIVLIIYKYRKRKPDDCEDEFNTIPLGANGSAHTAGNAV